MKRSILVVALAAIALAGCGKPPAAPAAPAPTPAPAATPAPATTPAPAAPAADAATKTPAEAPKADANKDATKK
jgi:hypothetical protein